MFCRRSVQQQPDQTTVLRQAVVLLQATVLHQAAVLLQAALLLQAAVLLQAPFSVIIAATYVYSKVSVKKITILAGF